MTQVPSLDLDPFSESVLSDPFEAYAALRDAGPVVFLPRYGIHALARHHELRRMLHDVTTFISSAGVGLTNLREEPGIRSPSLILESDPPAHARPRAVLSRVLSAEVVEGLRAGFRNVARELVDQLLERREIDAARDGARAFALQVFPDAVGLGPESRDNLVLYADLLFNANGPKNALFERSLREAAPLTAWVLDRCRREQLRPGGLGAQIYGAADAGEITAEEAALLVRSLLSAGVDTTIAAIGNALFCLAERPEQWRELHAQPALARYAFEEALRFETPSPIVFRTTARATEVAGHTLAGNRKVLLVIGAANRDPRRWEEPDRFDIARRPVGHLAFGSGIHACVGQIIARVEAEALLEELARRVARIELAGPPRRWLNNAVRSLASLPLRLTPA